MLATGIPPKATNGALAGFGIARDVMNEERVGLFATSEASPVLRRPKGDLNWTGPL